jgi:hypothetical protein
VKENLHSTTHETATSVYDAHPYMTSSQSRLGVARIHGEFRAVATEVVAPGDLITTIEGVLVRRPSRYSIQVGEDQHLDGGDLEGLPEVLDRRPWRFLNHACAPNAVVRGRGLFALKRIAPMQEVTFDYNTTELDMAEPFPCRCGAARCVGVVGGFKRLSDAERERRRPHLAPYLAARLALPATTSGPSVGA